LLLLTSNEQGIDLKRFGAGRKKTLKNSMGNSTVSHNQLRVFIDVAGSEILCMLITYEDRAQAFMLQLLAVESRGFHQNAKKRSLSTSQCNIYIRWLNIP